MRAYTILVPGNTEASGTILPVEYGLLSDKGWLDLLQPQETQVYFLQRPSDQHVKIGYTRNVSGRVKESGRDNGGVVLLATEPGGRAREAELHRQFAECRVASNHEWFFPVARLMDYIALLQAQ